MTFSARARIVQAGAAAAAALLAASAAAPLQAATVDQQAAQPQSQNANSERRICVRMEMPSTRLARRVCRTRAEWDALGGVPGSD